MGCTSSAPNTVPPNSHTADKSIQFEEETNENPSIEVDVADTEDENQTNETKMLPSCDTFEETVQLVRNNKSSTSLTTEKDVPVNGHVTESESAVENSENIKDEVKIPKLELLMNKVFETNHHLTESGHKVREDENTSLDPNNDDESTEKKYDVTGTAMDPEFSDKPETEVEHKSVEAEKEPEESSPSQSQSSRATRWEALADIAAELPPSLAVDPLTGQIYQIAQTK